MAYNNARGYKGRNAKTDANQKEIIDALTVAGCTVVQIDKPVDLLVGRHGLTFLLEVKNREGKNRLTKAQEEFIETWRGRPVAVVHDVDEALSAVGLGVSGLSIATVAR